MIDHGKAEKKAGVAELRIEFNRRFSKLPNVVISNNWENVRDGSGAHNILNIEHDHFVVFSGISANNYFIQWIAVSDEPAAFEASEVSPPSDSVSEAK